MPIVTLDAYEQKLVDACAKLIDDPYGDDANTVTASIVSIIKETPALSENWEYTSPANSIRISGKKMSGDDFIVHIHRLDSEEYHHYLHLNLKV